VIQQRTVSATNARKATADALRSQPHRSMSCEACFCHKCPPLQLQLAKAAPAGYLANVPRFHC